MTPSQRGWGRRSLLLGLAAVLLLAAAAEASTGDRLVIFRNCVRACKADNCEPDATDPMEIPLHRRLLLWDCPAECDYLCQHSTTARRLTNGRPVVQFHGKWPFRRLLGMQEPFSVLFSLANLWAHASGLAHLRASVPPSYPLRRFYTFFARVGIASWVFSSIFHTRDLTLTEELDYLAAGASVLCGLYYTAVRVFRLDRPDRASRGRLRTWSVLCGSLYAAHVVYLKGVRWSYSYNMKANVVVGVTHNVLWYWLSVQNYRRTGRAWTLVPIVVVTWIMLAGFLELFDFPPLWGCLDAHSLWHLGTIAPVYILYRYLVKDALEDMSASKKKFAA